MLKRQRLKKKRNQMEEERKTNEELIKDLTDKIVGNSKDAHFAKSLIQQLAGLYQMDKLIDIPLKYVKETIDLGACAIHRVKDGYVFEAKGGLKTHVSLRMARVCAMLNTLFELRKSGDKELYSSFSTAIEYIFESPIFSSLDERALFQNATAILSSYMEFCTENYANAEAKEESEEDIKSNNEFEQMGQAIEALADVPLPPED